jgi:hypothetical protein
MAKQVKVLLVDDIDGTPAESTVRFGLDGILYQIDLSGENNDALRKALAKFILKGTKLGRAHPGHARVAAQALVRVPVDANRERNAAIRAWAEEQGIAVSARGRLQEAVVAKYDAAHAA